MKLGQISVQCSVHSTLKCAPGQALTAFWKSVTVRTPSSTPAQSAVSTAGFAGSCCPSCSRQGTHFSKSCTTVRMSWAVREMFFGLADRILYVCFRRIRYALETYGSIPCTGTVCRIAYKRMHKVDV